MGVLKSLNMKQTLLYSVFAALVLLAGCRKEDDVKLPDLVRVPLPLITKDAGSDATISKDDPAAFKGKFVVDLFFKSDVPPQKFDVVIRKNDETTKTFKPDVTTFPTTMDITGADLTSLFGAAPVLGDKYEVGVDITLQDGTKLEAFPLGGPAYGSNVANQPGASTSVIYSVVCPFEMADFVGSATIEDPDFWEATYPVTVTLQGTDTYKISGWFEDPDLFILVKVDAAALTAVIESQVYAPSIPGSSYTNWTAEGTGVIDACNKQLVMSIKNSVDQGSFDPVTITLKK
jgi:hypothetical protein